MLWSGSRKGLRSGFASVLYLLYFPLLQLNINSLVLCNLDVLKFTKPTYTWLQGDFYTKNPHYFCVLELTKCNGTLSKAGRIVGEKKCFHLL